MKYILNEDISTKKYILHEDILDLNNSQIKQLSLKFEDVFKAEAKNSKFFNNKAWNPEGIAKANRLAELEKFLVVPADTEASPAYPTRNLLWNAYFSWIWEDKASIVKKLDATLTTELFAYGFSIATNPFLSYLSKILNANIDITAAAYTAIHNLVAKKLISTERLKIKQPSIIYCKGLLQLTNASLAYRLGQLENALLSKINSAGESYKIDNKDPETLKTLIAFCFFKLKDIVAVDASWDNYTEYAKTNKIPDDIFYNTTDLRDENEVKVIITQLFGTIKKEKSLDKVDNPKAENLWLQLKGSLTLDPVRIGNFFAFLLLKKAQEKTQYAKSKEIILTNSNIPDDALKVSTTVIADNIELYNNFIDGLDITSENLAEVMTVLFNNIPEELKKTTGAA